MASPVKFAEYLACGLGIVISANLGDYTNFVKQHKCGCSYSEFNFNRLDKVYLKKLGLTYFTKNAYLNSYKKLLY